MSGKILLERSEHRIVESGGLYHVEKKDGTDALGVERWRPGSKAPVEPPHARFSRGNDDESDGNTIELPIEVFRALCELVKSSRAGEQIAAVRAVSDERRRLGLPVREGLRGEIENAFEAASEARIEPSDRQEWCNRLMKIKEETLRALDLLNKEPSK